jgi:hypothetical protein
MSATPHAPDKQKLLVRLRSIQIDLSALILGTPTGPARNALCDANIYLGMAEEVFTNKKETRHDGLASVEHDDR